MVLKSRGISNLTVREYRYVHCLGNALTIHKSLVYSEARFWRNNGVAFTWLEGEPVRSNPTLLSNIIQHGPGFIHYAYLGDIANGPFFTWVLEEAKDDHK